MDVSQYLEIFIDETKEHLQSLNTQILDLEQNPENMDTINEIFRAAHSLKGMAGTMGYKRMQNLTHDMENVFSEVRNGTVKVNAAIIDVLFQCLDALDEYLTNIQSGADEGTNDNANLIKELNDFLKGDNKESAPAAAPQQAAASPADKNQAVQPEGQTDTKDKWKSMALGDAQMHVLREAKKQGKNLIGLTIYVQESCILKAARAFLVYKTLEDIGEIIVSSPSAQDIEDEKFEFDFSIIMVSDATVEKAIAAAKNVSEIEDVVGGEVYVAQDDTSEATEKKEEKAVAAQKPGLAVKQEPEKTVEKKKPVVNRTVRVDIEKLDDLMNLVSELIIAKNSLVSATTAKQKDGSSVNEQI